MSSAEEEALLKAAEKNNHKELKRLLTAGVPSDYANNNGETAVWFASRNVCLECLKVLRAFNANLDARLKSGVSGLWIAAANGHFEVIQTLLEGHADPNIPDARGITPLWTAASYGFHDIVKLLLKYGADCDRTKDDGKSCLWVACQSNFRQVVEILIIHCAGLELSTFDRQTPLMAAAEGGFIDIVKILIEKRANVDAQSTDGHTALSLAACNGHDPVVLLLLSAGSNPCISDMQAITPTVCPLAQCCAYERSSTARLLWDLVSEEQRCRAVEVCKKLDYTDLAHRLLSHGSACSRQASSSSDLSLSDLAEKMTCAGFTMERSRVQAAAADIVQDILQSYFHKSALYVLGSFGDGWGCNLSTADGSIGTESDIDFAEIMSRQKFHLKGLCKCRDIKEEKIVEYLSGHVLLNGKDAVGSRPAMTTEATPVSPSMDVVYAYAVCSYPRLNIVNESDEDIGHFPKEIATKLRTEIAAPNHPFHLIRAGTPDNEGTQLRVSTSILERIVLRSLSTEQGQFYILLKFIVKKVLGVCNQEHQSLGLKSYHAKSLLLFMLREAPSDDWTRENLRRLLISALNMLTGFMVGTSDEEFCMPHFFLKEAVLYLKKEHSSKRNILEHVNHVINNIDQHLCEFRDQLKPLRPVEYYSLHVFSLFPFGFSLFDDSIESDNEFHNAYINIKQCLQLILNMRESLPQNILPRIEGLPPFVQTAKHCLTALMYLRMGKSGEDAARCLLSEHGMSSVCRHLCVSEEDNSESTKECIFNQLRTCDSIWRMCCRIDLDDCKGFAAFACTACFPCHLPNHERRLYLNFDVLLQLLKLRLLGPSVREGVRAWSQSVLENSCNADFEELYAAALLASNVSTKQFVLKAMRRLFRWRHEKTDGIINEILGAASLQVGIPTVQHDSSSGACFRLAIA